MNTAIVAPDVNLIGQSVDIRSLETDIVSLDDRLIDSYSRAAVSTAIDKQTIMNRINNSNLVTSPEELAVSQVLIADHNLRISEISTLTRKAVGAAETLLRS